MRACRACGVQLNDQARFCHRCGTEFMAPFTEAPGVELVTEGRVAPRPADPMPHPQAASRIVASPAKPPALWPARLGDIGRAARILAMAAGVAAFGLWLFLPRPAGVFTGVVVAVLGFVALAAAWYGRHLGQQQSKAAVPSSGGPMR